MSMQFTLRITGDISTECEASSLGLDDLDGNELFDNYDVDINDVSVEGTVNITARASTTIDIDAADMKGFDADVALQEKLSPYGGVEADNVEYDVEDSPTGYYDVLEAVGYDSDTAIAVYAALAANGHEVV